MRHRTFVVVTAGETTDCGMNSATDPEMVAFAERFGPLDIRVDPEATASTRSAASSQAASTPSRSYSWGVVEQFYADSDLLAARDMDRLRLPCPFQPDNTFHVILKILEDKVSGNGRGVVTTRRKTTVEGRRSLSRGIKLPGSGN